MQEEIKVVLSDQQNLSIGLLESSMFFNSGQGPLHFKLMKFDCIYITLILMS